MIIIPLKYEDAIKLIFSELSDEMNALKIDPNVLQQINNLSTTIQMLDYEFTKFFSLPDVQNLIKASIDFLNTPISQQQIHILHEISKLSIDELAILYDKVINSDSFTIPSLQQPEVTEYDYKKPPSSSDTSSKTCNLKIEFLKIVISIISLIAMITIAIVQHFDAVTAHQDSVNTLNKTQEVKIIQVINDK